jgi:hypothetical protein
MEQYGSRPAVNANRPYWSKPELQIARLLERNGIAYKYEHPMAVMDRGRMRIWYPDFYLPKYGMIIEYFGVNGDAGYNERTKHKTEVYQDNGVQGLFLKEDDLKGDWPTKVMGGIENILKARLEKFRSRKGRARSP